jgi:hypothetical protein
MPSGVEAAIAVAAEGFDSTGSKLTEPVRDVEEMASVRLPRLYVMAVIDGTGWAAKHAYLPLMGNAADRRHVHP